MRIHVKSFGSQAGGSTLIGLVLGVCTGILMLIKWPELADYIEPHVQQLMVADLDSVSEFKTATVNENFRVPVVALGIQPRGIKALECS